MIVRELQANRVGEASIVGDVLFYDPFYVYAHTGSALLEPDAVDILGALRGRQLRDPARPHRPGLGPHADP